MDVTPGMQKASITELFDVWIGKGNTCLLTERGNCMDLGLKWFIWQKKFKRFSHAQLNNGCFNSIQFNSVQFSTSSTSSTVTII